MYRAAVFQAAIQEHSACDTGTGAAFASGFRPMDRDLCESETKRLLGILGDNVMKHKYWIGILCVCVLMSVTGCGMDAGANVQAENSSEDNTDADAQANPSDDNVDTSAQSEVDAETADNVKTAVALPEYDQEESTKGDYCEESTVVEEEYSNPIDAYFLPCIENASCEAERRQMQDTYRGVWKTEFENVMVWMQDKCVYQEDKDNLLLLEESVGSLIEATHTVWMVTDYELPPGSDGRKSWGNGTRSAWNQKEGEIYRDVSMKLINDTYIFMERDYSLEYYE